MFSRTGLVSCCLIEKEGIFVTTSSHNQLRLVFSLVPRSISHRLRQLTGKTAGELLRLLCELTVGFRKSSIERSYRQLAVLLGKSVVTIARAARFLLRNGDVIAEGRPGRSYCWSVLLESNDILSDPAGVCTVRPAAEEDGDPVATVTLAAEEPVPLAPVLVEASEPQASVEVDADTTVVVERDVLLKRLTNLGMRRRVARELLDEHDTDVIVAAIERAKGRSDIKNRAAYVLCEVRDGGYEESREMLGAAKTLPERGMSSPDISENYSSAETTRAEMVAMEAEKAAKQQGFEQTLQDLQERCSGLSDGLKARLRECCKRHLFQLVPSTSRRDLLLESPAYKKLAFKDVMERFFSLTDHGLAPEEAVTQLVVAL